MRYKTVKDVIEFVGNLKAKETTDSQLKIHVEFYEGDDFVGELVRSMCSEYIIISFIEKSLSDYFVTDFKIEIRDYCVAFVLSIKEPSSI